MEVSSLSWPGLFAATFYLGRSASSPFPQQLRVAWIGLATSLLGPLVPALFSLLGIFHMLGIRNGIDLQWAGLMYSASLGMPVIALMRYLQARANSGSDRRA